jgi:hypothetical protein
MKSSSKRAMPVTYFDGKLPNANEQVALLGRVWSDVILLFKHLHLKLDPELYDEVFSHYFKPSERERVDNVWRVYMGAKDMEDQGELLGDSSLNLIVWTNKPTPNDACDNEEESTLAWLDYVQKSGRSVMRVCDEGWKFPLLGDTKCEDMGDRVSGMMSSLAGVILHELM